MTPAAKAAKSSSVATSAGFASVDAGRRPGSCPQLLALRAPGMSIL